MDNALLQNGKWRLLAVVGRWVGWAVPHALDIWNNEGKLNISYLIKIKWTVFEGLMDKNGTFSNTK